MSEEKKIPELLIEVEPEYNDGDVIAMYGMFLELARMNNANRRFEKVVSISTDFITGVIDIKRTNTYDTH